MPDMDYSRAYETYGYNDVNGENDSLEKRGIIYNAYLCPEQFQGRHAILSSYLRFCQDESGRSDLKNPLDPLAADTKWQ